MVPGSFAQVIRTSGQIQAAQGDEEIIVATTNGVVSFPDKTSSKEQLLAWEVLL